MKSYLIEWTNKETRENWNCSIDLDLTDYKTADQKIDKIKEEISKEFTSKHGKILGTWYIYIKTISTF